jgi:hypothetical protein
MKTAPSTSLFSQLSGEIKYLMACNPPDIRLATRPERVAAPSVLLALTNG